MLHGERLFHNPSQAGQHGGLDGGRRAGRRPPRCGRQGRRPWCAPRRWWTGSRLFGRRPSTSIPPLPGQARPQGLKLFHKETSGILRDEARGTAIAGPVRVRRHRCSSKHGSEKCRVAIELNSGKAGFLVGPLLRASALRRTEIPIDVAIAACRPAAERSAQSACVFVARSPRQH